MVLAWGMAQRPYAAADHADRRRPPPATPTRLRWLLIVTVVAVVVVGPALALLYRLDLTDRLAADHDIDLTAAHAAPEATMTSRGLTPATAGLTPGSRSTALPPRDAERS